MCKEVASLLTKERLTLVGADFRRLLSQPNLASLPPLSVSLQAEADILLGMNVMIAGDPTKVASRGMSIADITASALVVRKKAGETVVKEETLVMPGDAGANLLYTMGGVAAHYPFWGSYLPVQKDRQGRDPTGHLHAARDTR